MVDVLYHALLASDVICASGSSGTMATWPVRPDLGQERGWEDRGVVGFPALCSSWRLQLRTCVNSKAFAVEASFRMLSRA